MSDTDEVDDHVEVPGHRLLHVIGRGSSAVVWSGLDATGRPVAVKVPNRCPDPVAVRQAEIERHVLMAVQHDHLVQLRDVVGLADGRVALVFDLVVGATLQAMVRARGHLRPGETVTLVTPIVEAVATLHAAGGTHSDISAGNVMVNAAGRPMLMDLGSARLAGSGAGAIVGTPGFVAPEVREGGAPSEASDVFSIGALAWFCLTGNGAPDTIERLSEETLRSHLGDELAQVVGACIDPDPDQRPASGALAGRFFAAAPTEPIEVVVGADEASALTHRLRAEAADERDRAGRASTQPPADRVRARSWFRLPARPKRGVSQRLGVIAAVTALAVGVGWLVQAGALPGAADAPPPRAADQARDVRASPTSVKERPVQLLQDLTDRRTTVLTARDASALGEIHRSGSPSWRADAKVIADLVGARQRYDGLHMTVREARHISGEARRATIRARVDVSAYVVVSEDGARQKRDAAAGDVLDFGLVRDAEGWRIEAITQPATTGRPSPDSRG